MKVILGHEVDIEHFSCSKLIIISRKGAFYSGWISFEFILNILSAYFYMWMATFYEDLDHNLTYLNIHIAFEILFVLGMVVKLITDFHLPGDTEPVRDPETVFYRYIKSWVFVLDLITVIPLT